MVNRAGKSGMHLPQMMMPITMSEPMPDEVFYSYEHIFEESSSGI